MDGQNRRIKLIENDYNVLKARLEETLPKLDEAANRSAESERYCCRFLAEHEEVTLGTLF